MEEKDPEATEEEPLPVVGSKGAMPSFDEVFMVSALSGDGVEQVKVITNGCTNIFCTSWWNTMSLLVWIKYSIAVFKCSTGH